MKMKERIESKSDQFILWVPLLFTTVLFSYAIPIAMIGTNAVLYARYSDVTDDLARMEPMISVWAIWYWWIFLAMHLLVAFGSVLFARSRRGQGRQLGVVVSGIWLQIVIAWVVAFCYCYDGFIVYSVHSFHIERFLAHFWGFFPAVLITLALSAVALVRYWRTHAENPERAVCEEESDD